ncbi:MAG: cytochrome d ubiquinol oxidase subunit II [Actinomycetaceae bacterium]|nr:cytochrome d ubiquinol oxidase subunit II [Actinomycetaceae bacterium]
MITSLQFIWFVTSAVLMAGMFTLVGIDLGVGLVLLSVGKNLRERGEIVRTIAPHWGAHGVWLITVVTSWFAGFPEWYAALLSGLQNFFVIMVVALVMRVVCIEWREHVGPGRARLLDYTHALAAFFVAAGFVGILSSMITGLPVVVVNARTGAIAPPNLVHPLSVRNPNLSAYVHSVQGTDLVAITLYAAFGTLAICWFMRYLGATWIGVYARRDTLIGARSARIRRLDGVVAPVLLFAWTLWGYFVRGGGMVSYFILAILAVTCVAQFYFRGRSLRSPRLVGLPLALVVVWAWSAAYPILLPSTLDHAYDLSIAWAASSDASLGVLVVACIFGVIMALFITFWSHRTFRVDSRLSSTIDG